ncbi:hypothetical protein C7N43_01485 [Sphingobacteriales bacterium UPWRP_1]|nr:hypothetical protein BVG80_10455 [Sphingobacteriales bacterium TSM_CSM]PSJ78839.1 hypothetical protein C7N43_01485 [Sphingobacteriales bacterium UPWRP_1]
MPDVPFGQPLLLYRNRFKPQTYPFFDNFYLFGIVLCKYNMVCTPAHIRQTPVFFKPKLFGSLKNYSPWVGLLKFAYICFEPKNNQK